MMSDRLAVLRVALAHLKRATLVDLDMLSRVQVLEGALGKKLLSGSQPGRPELQQALREAHWIYIDHKANPHPDWFSVSDTGMYGRLLGFLKATLTKHGVDSSVAEEIMQEALMGLSRDSRPSKQTKRPLVEAGKADGHMAVFGGKYFTLAIRH